MHIFDNHFASSHFSLGLMAACSTIVIVIGITGTGYATRDYANLLPFCVDAVEPYGFVPTRRQPWS
jgi:hypothetical protein